MYFLMSCTTFWFLLLSFAQVALSSIDNDWYMNNWCGHGLQYLDDSKCAKSFPNGYVEDTALSSIEVDTSVLSSIVPPTGAQLCVILTKRIRGLDDASSTKLFNKYFCVNGAEATAYETWSSSKIFAMANAAGRLRQEESSSASSSASCTNDETTVGVGYTSTTGTHGETPLGDLSTVVCSYDHTAGYSSNALSSYFHDLGMRSRLCELVTNTADGGGGWLNSSASPTQTLGGNYGEVTPADLGFTLSSLVTEASDSCEVTPDAPKTTYSNTLSSLSAAEMTRRIALHRDVPPSLQFPGVVWEDVQAILYGAESSLLFPSIEWGGMSTDTAIFVQSALNMTQISEESNGNFRIFSKLGAGYSSSRYVGEILNNAYACLPSSDGGLEFTISVRGSIPDDFSLVKVEEQVRSAVQDVVSAIVSGVIA